MSREAVLLQWERKIEVAERLEDDGPDAPQPVPLRPAETGTPTRTRRFERVAPEPAEAPAAPAAERRTITITGQPTPAPRRRAAVIDSQLARPDRVALWAFLLGLLLVAVAAGTAHG